VWNISNRIGRALDYEFLEKLTAIESGKKVTIKHDVQIFTAPLVH
jgi:hypothetical protein